MKEEKYLVPTNVFNDGCFSGTLEYLKDPFSPCCTPQSHNRVFRVPLISKFKTEIKPQEKILRICL